MIISIDYDDVLFPLIEPLVFKLNQIHKLNINTEDISGWNIEDYVPLTKEQIFEPIHNDFFWESLQPNEDALWFVNKILSDGFELQVITASFYQDIKPKVQRLLKCFPLSWDNVIVTSKKQRIITDFLVDDAFHNLISASYKGILLDKPHNRKHIIKEKGVFRVFNLYEAYEKIKEFV